jgi:hypothetical protein
MVQVKKIAMFLISLLFAFITVEVFLQFVIGFPTYEVEKKITGIKSASSGTQNVFKANSGYFTVEGGLKIYKRNNLGFTGLDVDNSKEKRFVALLGNSYLEAYQESPDRTSAGILQQKLRDENSNYEIINLGVSGHDPLDLLYRVNYYSKFYKFEKVILVITDSQADWLKRHSSIKFDRNLPVTQNKSLFTKYLIPLRNNSVLLDLLAKTINTKEEQNDAVQDKPTKKTQRYPIYDAEYDIKLKSIFEEYYKMFGQKFVVVNIASNEEVSIPIKAAQYLTDCGIKYKFKPLNLPENKINGKGHLNLKGNKKLGEVLYEVLQ